jgi:hypothetical protein
MFLHQRTYMLDIIKRAAMADCKPCTTPVDLHGKLAVTLELLFRTLPSFRALQGLSST